MSRSRIVILLVGIGVVLACLGLAVFGNWMSRTSTRCPEGTTFVRAYQNQDSESGFITASGIVCVTTEGEEIRLPDR